jgi:hypothetical protein
MNPSGLLWVLLALALVQVSVGRAAVAEAQEVGPVVLTPEQDASASDEKVRHGCMFFVGSCAL